MTCAEFKDLVHAFALDALEPDEMAACEAHLAGSGPHEGCEAELDQARAAVGALGEALPPLRPAPKVWASIEQELAEELGQPIASSTSRRSLASMALPWVATVAAAAVAGFFYLSQENMFQRAESLEERLGQERSETQSLGRETVRLRETSASCDTALKAVRADLQLRDEAVALLQLPTTRVVPLAPQGAKTSHATVVLNVLERRAVVMASGLTPATDKDYELWVIRGNDKLAAGLLHGTDPVAVIDPALLASADAFAVTLEPAGGGPTPRGELIMVGIVPKT